MDAKEAASEQRKVYVALSAFATTVIQSTSLKAVVVNMPEIRRDGEEIIPRKYRPERSLPVAPLDLKF